MIRTLYAECGQIAPPWDPSISWAAVKEKGAMEEGIRILKRRGSSPRILGIYMTECHIAQVLGGDHLHTHLREWFVVLP